MKFITFKLGVLFVLQAIKRMDSEILPTVQTNVGEIIGTARDVTVYGRQMRVNRFFGIPYAEPPVDDLRFKKSIPKKPFTSPFKAIKQGNACLEMILVPLSDEKEISHGEDCLSLNVFVPAERQESLAVMVWIFGGAFVCGSSDIYIADTLAAHGDVIVVTINYRTSIWGFLSTGDEHAPGNYGLWDQHLALRWVHDNINAFGGDPYRITIFGESAGGGSVVYQSLYEGNKGLFQRAIAQSGSITAKWATCKTAKEDAIQLGKLVGCESPESETLMKCLKSKSPDILNATLNDVESGFLRVDIPFLPVVDGEFVKEPPIDLLTGVSNISNEGRKFFASLDFMSGVNAEEGLEMISPWIGIDDPENFEPNRTYFENVLIPLALSIEFGDDVPSIVNDFVIQEYTDWSDPENVDKRRSNLVDLFSDTMFTIPHIETVIRHRSVAKDSKSTYMYFFDVLPSVRPVPVPSWSQSANHGDDLIYTFFEESDGIMTYISGHEEFQPTEELRKNSKYFMTILCNFAKTGNPNKPTPVKMYWPAFTEKQQQYLHITQEMTSDSIKSHFRSKEFDFWRNIIPRVYNAMKKPKL